MDEGNNPKITSIVSDETKPRGTVVKGGTVVVNGQMMYAAGDTVKVVFKHDSAEDVVVEQTAMATYGSDLLKFTCPSALVSTATYDVVVERTDENGVTRKSEAKKVTVEAGTSPIVTKVTSDYIGELPEGYDPNAVVVEDMPGSIYGENLDGATVRLVSSGGASTTLENDPDSSSEGVWAFLPTSGNFANPCSLTVTTSAGTYNFAVKYYKPE